MKPKLNQSRFEWYLPIRRLENIYMLGGGFRNKKQSYNEKLEEDDHFSETHACMLACVKLISCNTLPSGRLYILGLDLNLDLDLVIDCLRCNIAICMHSHFNNGCSWGWGCTIYHQCRHLYNSVPCNGGCFYRGHILYGNCFCLIVHFCQLNDLRPLPFSERNLTSWPSQRIWTTQNMFAGHCLIVAIVCLCQGLKLQLVF